VASIASDIQQILDLAPRYSKESTLDMNQRARLTDDLVERLEGVLDEIAGPSGLARLDLEVDRGGQQGYVSPYPWVRIYSKRYAPSAQHGIYLVYLFAADGSRAYLSLNQGTSVPKPSGGERTTSDLAGLSFRAAQARSALGDHIEGEGAADATMSIDLAWQGLSSRDSQGKGRAYESANILAHEYLSGHVPADERLLDDLVDMLPLLAELYGVPPMPTQAPHAVGLAARAVGAMNRERLDPETRKKIELWAEDSAYKYFTKQGWKVERVGSQHRGYDLECTQDGLVLHVEVKGTQTRGEKVVLTGNEVKHNRDVECEAAHALYVVSEIKVSRDDDAQCSGGKVNRVLPWIIADEDLLVTEYSYAVPKS
jgi:hypothetical protein